MKLQFLLTGALFVLGTAGAPASPTSGIAYDVVWKLQATGDFKYDAKTFDDDFRAASDNSVLSVFSGGQAERHYVTPSRERTDTLAFKRATIVDCEAKTVTTLDLAAKTYTVKTVDEVQSPSSPSPASAMPDLSKSKITVANDNRSLGVRDFDGIPTDGYHVESTMASTIGGMVQESKSISTQYYTRTELPMLACPDMLLYTIMTSSTYSPAMLRQITAEAKRAGATASQNFKMTNTGLALPKGRLVLLETSKMDMQLSGMTMSMITTTERGHIRPISSDDPIFTVPVDFKRSE